MKKVFWRRLVVLVLCATVAHQVLGITHAEKRTRIIVSNFGTCRLVATTVEVDREGVVTPAVDSQRSTAVAHEKEEVVLTETAEEGTFIVVNRAELARLTGERFGGLMESCNAFLEGNENRTLDADEAYQKERGKQLAVACYPSKEAAGKARWLRDWLSKRIAPGSTIVLIGDEVTIPTWQVHLGGMRLTTDSFYSDLNGDGMPDTAVARIVGEPDSMIRQLAGKRDYGSKAVILCSEDTRIHLETRAFAKSLSKHGFGVAIRGARDDEALSASDVIVHFGHGTPSGISNRFGEAFVSAGEMPLLRRSPIVFVDGCGTLPVGSPLLRAFLKQGALAYVGSTATVQGMIPARLTNELVEHFLCILAKEPRWPLPQVLTAARAAYVRGHPGLSEKLRQLAATGAVENPGDDLGDILTVVEWVYYGDPRASIPNVASSKEMSHKVVSLDKPIRLDDSNTIWQTSFPMTATDGQTVLAVYADVPLSERTQFGLSVRQNSKEIFLLDSSDETEYQNIGNDCRGGYVSGETYRARFLVPLNSGDGEQQLEVRLVKGTSAILTPGTEVDTWPSDFEKRIGFRLTPPPGGPERAVDPIKAVGAAKVRQTGKQGFVSLDLASLFNRPHNSVGVGGDDNASFKTWFSDSKVFADGVPFLVERTGNDVLVSESNTQNVYEIKEIGASARALHFLIWGYNLPMGPARLSVTFSDGTSQECELPLSEWTRAIAPVAFDLENTADFPHAAIAHQVIKIAHPEKRIVSISSTSGTYGLVAITLEKNPPEPAPESSHGVVR